ncbi:MAG: sterol desaturase family protein [Chromatiaceae bacterium]|jgi:sterol desaturase/sphingolipid hydroxylase (fatty acid hydroxylase superfamily)
MPTPIDILSDPITLAIIAIYGAIIAWEAAAPARPLPAVRRWPLKGAAALLLYVMISTYLPLFWTETLAQYQVFDLADLGTWGGAAVGLFVLEAGIYAWHRALHTSALLWRGFHQMHHSAERLDTWSAFWFSPLDVAGLTAIASLCLTLVVGITAQAATIVMLAAIFFTVFQHANVHTPRWLGYLVQRPESHSLHHERGVHGRNYTDLPLFDILFGTFANPREFARTAGFYDGASSRVIDMIAFRDVSRPPDGRETVRAG